MNKLDRLRMSLTLTPFERRVTIFIFLMVVLGNFYSFIRDKDKEEINQDRVMLYDEDEIIKININTAPVDSLIMIPGIGEKTARIIIRMREKQKFIKVEDLLKVKGVGYKKLERIKPYISLE
jgi:competence ComEA-like helix-hairpin-helix protein